MECMQIEKTLIYSILNHNVTITFFKLIKRISEEKGSIYKVQLSNENSDLCRQNCLYALGQRAVTGSHVYCDESQKRAPFGSTTWK